MCKRAFIAALAATLILPAIALPMGAKPDDSRTYYFDGSSFREGKPPGLPAIETRIGYYPRTLAGDGISPLRPLPAGTGALAGICYLQQAGGKLGNAPQGHALAGILVTVRGGDIEREISCDDRGFFSLALPPGRYEVRSGADSRAVTVEPEKTTLAPLRGGKRMVD